MNNLNEILCLLFTFLITIQRSTLANNQVRPDNSITMDNDVNLYQNMDDGQLPRSNRVKRDGEMDDSQGACVPGTAMKHDGNLTRSIYIDNVFKNPWPTWNGQSFRVKSILKLAMLKDHSNIPDSKKLDETLPILKPNFSQQPPDNGLRITWIGHSTLVVQIDGMIVLTDPMFSTRASPSQLFGPKRYRPPACVIEDLPESLDAVVISHNHYDHLDAGSVSALNNRYGTKLRWFVPIGLKKWFEDMKVKNVVELDWWEEYCVNEDFKFVLTPAQHWSKRGLNDDFSSLWGSWSIIGPKNRFFFTGDTGYCSVFKEIGQIYGPFTAAAIPIGAYSPRWFMGPQHVDPESAVQIHRDIRSKSSMAIHWGTFALAYEFYLDPPKELKEALEMNSIPLNEFVAFKHGESRVLPIGPDSQATLSDVFYEKHWNASDIPTSNASKSADESNYMIGWLNMFNQFFNK